MSMENNLDLTELLDYIDPRDCDYTEWLNVGMALKESGYACSVWEEWSRRDPGRYHAGETFRKWDSFKGTSVPVTGGTLVQMAKERGWNPGDGGHELDWNDEIGGRDDHVVVQKGWIESQDFKEPGDDWKPEEQLITYLDVLFNDDENVGYVTEVWEKDDRLLPTSGSYDRTAGQLKAELRKCKGDLGAVLGDYNKAAGAWIRFNPLDGKGVRNDNVTDLRYALVESDETDLGQQNAILRELELPIAALVYSGKKSLHAIVHIGAPNYEEYRKRVEFLYDICRKNGLKPDKQNKNPSRLSRMPGIVRGEHKQFLLDTNIGKKNWDEWREWIEGVNDNLPDPESLTETWDNIPPLSVPLIDGVLRSGHKMLISGPSKAGKSFALIELVIAIAEGKTWLQHFPCTQGRVLYVNLELDRVSCLHRFRDVYTALKWPPRNIANIDIWNLRGQAIPMNKLAPKLIRRAAKRNYTAIIIDPIYKVLTGDENSADQMAAFCNQFDRVCHELGAAVIYCHHHSKGYQGQKRSVDRASGSGVFARDPDAILDMTQLVVSDTLANYLDDEGTAHVRTAWRIEGTLREFAAFEPVNVWFDYPLHVEDTDGTLVDAKPESDVLPYQKGGATTKSKSEKEWEGKIKKLMKAYQKLSVKGPVRPSALAMELGMPDKRTVYNWLEHCPYLTRAGGFVYAAEEDDDDGFETG